MATTEIPVRDIRRRDRRSTLSQEFAKERRLSMGRNRFEVKSLLEEKEEVSVNNNNESQEKTRSNTISLSKEKNYILNTNTDSPPVLRKVRKKKNQNKYNTYQDLRSFSLSVSGSDPKSTPLNESFFKQLEELRETVKASQKRKNQPNAEEKYRQRGSTIGTFSDYSNSNNYDDIKIPRANRSTNKEKKRISKEFQGGKKKINRNEMVELKKQNKKLHSELKKEKELNKELQTQIESLQLELSKLKQNEQ
eukprot:TRINITY_DN7351_c0_g2_i1.p1 TRINITY_DN7351_c0_g2~~TRINITY_DN7351_c0_g2_i1.p1  ORF type:complete len:250 (+),score=67.75 TRINITY_DN7351_c0_g2_i1:20-769(+)